MKNNSYKSIHSAKKSLSTINWQTTFDIRPNHPKRNFSTISDMKNTIVNSKYH